MCATVVKCMPGTDLELLRQAVDYAANKHKDQKRKDGSPYIIHPLAVAEIVAEMGLDMDAVLGAPEAVVEDNNGEAVNSAAEPAADVTAALEILKQVTQWAEPVKKGRFTYDDKQFYDSIAKQYASGKALSPKQVAAINKLAEKYKK